MKNKIIILTPFLLVCFSSLSGATVYENAEEGNTNHWTIHDNKPEGAFIENVFDKELNSHVIKLEGEGRRNAYRIGSKKTSVGWNNKEEKILKWKMNFSEKFKISVYVKTKKGYRVFYYTHKNRDKGLYKKRYLRIGLGEKRMNGTWQNISRDLEADLKKYEPNNKILTVNGIKIQGSGKIDDIALVSDGNGNPCITLKDLKSKIVNGQDVTTANTSCITDMNHLFYNLESFNQDISSWDTSNVENMNNMFSYASAFTGHDLSKWNVEKVMQNKFFLAEAGEGNTAPQWNLTNAMVNKAKEHCINNKTETNALVCLPKNIAYIVRSEDDIGGSNQRDMFLYKIDINTRDANLIDKSRYPGRRLSLVSLKGFPFIALSSDDRNLPISTLTFRNSNGVEQKGMDLIYHSIKEIKTLEKGKKLSLKYEKLDLWGGSGPVLYENIYEMRTPLNLTLISEEKI